MKALFPNTTFLAAHFISLYLSHLRSLFHRPNIILPRSLSSSFVDVHGMSPTITAFVAGERRLVSQNSTVSFRRLPIFYRLQNLSILLEGFGVGIISYTVQVYIAEISPQNMRGGLGAVFQLSVTIGILLAYILGMFVNWRGLAVMGILPCTILIPGLFFIPESPRWLAKMGMMDDFEASLQVLRGFDADITVELNEIKIGIGLLVLQQASGINGILFYASSIFKATERYEAKKHHLHSKFEREKDMIHMKYESLIQETVVAHSKHLERFQFLFPMLILVSHRKFHHLALKADGGGMDDGLDQDPMVLLSQAIMVPGLLSQRR
ncbi:Sugar transporter ERD6-like 6 [Dendrobium catenatum]|uniref:Sugar transporter ERD6-like 6 n=1 Tax=Dendrobium catenatum TaxID=906689 RepID=A0A2I0WT76_9ASPA|nr:Sugar transporter ERD6-like 6 [Dendrobium catenatum]